MAEMIGLQSAVGEVPHLMGRERGKKGREGGKEGEGGREGGKEGVWKVNAYCTLACREVPGSEFHYASCHYICEDRIHFYLRGTA